MLCAKALCLLLSSWLTQHGYDGAHRDAVLAYVHHESDFEADVITPSGACLFQWAGERRRKVLVHGACPSWEEQAAFADQELCTLFRGFWSSPDPRAHMRRHFGMGALDDRR